MQPELLDRLCRVINLFLFRVLGGLRVNTGLRSGSGEVFDFLLQESLNLLFRDVVSRAGLICAWVFPVKSQSGLVEVQFVRQCSQGVDSIITNLVWERVVIVVPYHIDADTGAIPFSGVDAGLV